MNGLRTNRIINSYGKLGSVGGKMCNLGKLVFMKLCHLVRIILFDLVILVQ